MPSVTQLIPNFLGGVSQQTDDKKLLNQVTDCINGYPDPTFGLLKRPGMKHINQLKKANGTVFTKSELDGAAWFFIDRAAAGSYIGAIKGSDIYVWTANEGTWCTVNNTTSVNYLTGTSQNDYHFVSIQDDTIITNRTVTATATTSLSPVVNAIATIKLKKIDSVEHSVTIQGVTRTFTPPNSKTADQALKWDPSDVNQHHMFDAIKDLIEDQQTANNSDFDGKWYLEGYANSIVIRRTTETNGVVVDYTQPSNVTYQSFTCAVSGGILNDNLEVFQDEVIDATKLTLESFHGHYVHVLNSNEDKDDVYFTFEAYDGVKGSGYWKESAANNIGNGFFGSTMPHRLRINSATTLTFEEIPYEQRKAGDKTTNPDPSFAGKKITATFFYNNRFGVISEDNVILSVDKDPYNFFARSVLGPSDTDPIDQNVTSIRPVRLTDVLPSPQGLLILSERQQFQMYTSDANRMTKANTSIRSLANYEMNVNIPPVDFGTSTAFVSTVPGYSKLFTLSLGDPFQPPVVIDISKTVLEWIPDTVDSITVSSPNSAVFLVDSGTSYVYIYRFYNNGEKDLFQAWTKWELPATIQAAKVLNDALVVVSQHEDEYTIGSIELDELPSGDVYATSDSFSGNVALDMATRPYTGNGIVGTISSVSSAGSGYSDATAVATTGGSGTGLTVDITTSSGGVTKVVINNRGKNYTASDSITISGGGGNATFTVETLAGVVYDEPNDITKVYVPYTPIDNKEAVMLLTVPTADKDTDAEIDSDQGYWAKAIERIEPTTNYRYFEVKGDFTDYADGIVVGYGYDLDVTLPKFYFQRQGAGADYTASLTINKVRLSAGRTGAIRFKLKPTGSNEWKDVQHTIEAGVYKGDTNPVVNEQVFALPIHQRNTNFELKVTSDFPYPVSLVSMMWEGYYSPRFHRRS